MIKNANFWPNLVVFGQKILTFTGESKSFDTHITEKPTRQLVRIVYGQAWDKMGQKHQYLALNDQKYFFLTKFGKNPNSNGRKQFFDQIWPKILIPMGGIKKNHLGTLFASLFGRPWENYLGPKSRFWAEKSDFCHTTPILVNDSFLALGMTVNFPPWDWFFDFPYRSYSSFCKKI